MNDPAMTATVMLTEDTVLEDLEYLTLTIDVTSDSTTAIVADVSASASSAKIFILDTSSEYNLFFTLDKVNSGERRGSQREEERKRKRGRQGRAVKERERGELSGIRVARALAVH